MEEKGGGHLEMNKESQRNAQTSIDNVGRTRITENNHPCGEWRDKNKGGTVTNIYA